jgi:hypothetical protein
MQDIDIVIKCKCGNLLTEISRETEPIYGDRLAITVEPCKDCLEAERDEGYGECMSDHKIGDDEDDA